jgi:hypothetical protein
VTSPATQLQERLTIERYVLSHVGDQIVTLLRPEAKRDAVPAPLDRGNGLDRDTCVELVGCRVKLVSLTQKIGDHLVG